MAKRITFTMIWVGIILVVGAMGLWENNDCSDKEFYIRAGIGLGIALASCIACRIHMHLKTERYKKSLKYRRMMEEIQEMKKSA